MAGVWQTIFQTNFLKWILFDYLFEFHIVNESNCIDTLKVSLEKDAHCAISWFDNNYMDANPDKFQGISLDRFGRPPMSIAVERNTIPSFDSIKVLGVTLDISLQNDTHSQIYVPRHKFK